MRRAQQITGLLLAAAVAVVGCSKSDAKAKKTNPRASVPKPETPVVKPVVMKPSDDEGFIAGPTPKTTVNLLVSFADGEAAYREGKYADAAAFFEDYSTTHPKNVWGPFMLGMSTWKNKDLPKAEKAFDAALTIDPKHMKSLVNLSRVLIDEKKFDDAVVMLTRAADIDGKSSDVHRLLGRAYQGQGISDEAEKAYRHAIDLDGKDAWSMNDLGLMLLGDKRAADALPLFTKAVELKKDVPAFQNNLGMALEQAGHYKAAATAYTGALSADPGYEKAKKNLARVSAVKTNGDDPAAVTVDAAVKK